jgi:hypothetical protein
VRNGVTAPDPSEAFDAARYAHLSPAHKLDAVRRLERN